MPRAARLARTVLKLVCVIAVCISGLPSAVAAHRARLMPQFEQYCIGIVGFARPLVSRVRFCSYSMPCDFSLWCD